MLPLTVGVTGDEGNGIAAAVETTLDRIRHLCPDIEPVLVTAGRTAGQQAAIAAARALGVRSVEAEPGAGREDLDALVGNLASVVIALVPQAVAGAVSVPPTGVLKRLATFIEDCGSASDLKPTQSPSGLVSGNLRDAFALVDRVALRYQRRFDRMLLATHVIAACMAITFLVYSVEMARDWLVVLCLALFGSGVLFWNVARRGDWHARRLEYRMLAEILRIMLIREAGGLSGATAGTPAYETLLHVQDSGLDWIRLVTRTLLLDLALRNEHRPFKPEIFREWIGDDDRGQMGYYRSRVLRCERRSRLTGWITLTCTAAAMAMVAGLLVLPASATAFRPWLVLAVFMLGVIAATRDAYARKRGDRELARQYRLMYRLFADGRDSLDADLPPEQQLKRMHDLGNAALLEHAEWLLLHREHGIEISRL